MYATIADTTRRTNQNTCKMKKLLIVPDIHGRCFWKEILPFADECEKIVFLGDYHDPYFYEGITGEQSVSNFKEIVSFANNLQGKVSLLLGNHDLSYYGKDSSEDWNVFANRYDSKNASEIENIFRDNKHLFKIIDVFEIKSNGRKFLFSHAGIHQEWINKNELITRFSFSDSFDVVFHTIENMFLAEDHKFVNSLKDIGERRGGYTPVGSMVWADCNEFMFQNTSFTQIFGHTQQEKTGVPVSLGTNICLDCRRSFYIDEYGDIRRLSDDVVFY